MTINVGLLWGAFAGLAGFLATAQAAVLPPVPVEFTLDKPGYVTLVIEDAEGRRVRNLVSETFFEAGHHVVGWDGLDESLKINKRIHGVYDVSGKLMAPGTYTVRGLRRDEIEMFYEFTPFNSGIPPWRTPDQAGGWLADHTPPADVLYLPTRDELVICTPVPEAGSGLIWVNREGKKRTGIRWVGGNWTGAERLARDAGAEADARVEVYTAAHTKNKTMAELRLCAISSEGKVRKVLVTNDNEWATDRGLGRIGGLAVHNSLMVVSLPLLDRVEFVDAQSGAELGKLSLERPEGLEFDDQGRLYVVSGKQIHRYSVERASPIKLSGKQVLVVGLEEPKDMLLHAGSIFVSDWGESQQVKEFDMQGKPVRTIGTPGRTLAGPYDPTRMIKPTGLAATPDGMLWVAESDGQTKRTSVFRIADGEFIRAFHGPARYGSGGNIDPKNKSRFYYSGMEFHLDWEKGTDHIDRIYLRSTKDQPGVDGNERYPEQPIYVEGRQYMTNAYNESEVAGADPLTLWIMRDGVIKRVAAAGSLAGASILRDMPGLQAKLGPRFNPAKDFGKVAFVWSDENDDGKVDESEVQVRFMIDNPRVGAVTVDQNLTLTTSTTLQLKVTGFTPGGAPRYDLAGAQNKIDDISVSGGSGGGQALPVGDYVVLTGGPMRGVKNRKVMWTYPSKWPSLHAGHHMPNRALEPGEMGGTTRLLGMPFRPQAGEAGDLWAINADPGMMYLMTGDGLFVGTLGGDLYQAKQWGGSGLQPEDKRGMKLDKINFVGENFLPTINQLDDGSIYMVAGKTHSSLIRIEGLESVRRFTAVPLVFTPKLRAQCEAYFVALAEQTPVPDSILNVQGVRNAPVIDGKLDDWDDAEWHSIYAQTIGRGRNAVTTKHEVALRISGEMLYVAYRTPERRLMSNRASTLAELFKSGGALDLMLGTNAAADPERKQAAVGDLRLLVAEVEGKVMAGIFRQVDPEAKEPPVAFSSPWRSIVFDSVTDVSSSVNLKNSGGNYEYSIPLEVLGLRPVRGDSIRGDVGILRGEGGETVQRLYWHNKATTLISDVPGEAVLTPAQWGTFHFTVE